MAFDETIYPIQPDDLQRKLLLEAMRVEIEKLDVPDTRHHCRALAQLHRTLEEHKGIGKVEWGMIQGYKQDHHVADTIDYSVQAVSQRKYVVTQRDTSAKTSLNWVLGERANDEMMPVVATKVITARVNLSVAQKIYAHLVLKREMPEELRKHLLSENEDEER